MIVISWLALQRLFHFIAYVSLFFLFISFFLIFLWILLLFAFKESSLILKIKQWSCS